MTSRGAASIDILPDELAFILITCALLVQSSHIAVNQFLLEYKKVDELIGRSSSHQNSTTCKKRKKNCKPLFLFFFFFVQYSSLIFFVLFANTSTKTYS